MNPIEVTLITGASSGIGYEMARIYMEKGHNLLLVARSEDKLLEMISLHSPQFKGTLFHFPLDLSDPNSAQKLYDHCKAQQFRVTRLINNAGFGLHGSFLELNLEEQMQMMQLNMATLTRLCYLFGADMMQAGGGKVMNVASIAAFLSGPNMAVYFATKNFVLALSEALHYEWKNMGVTVTTLCPGPTESQFFDRASMQGMRMLRMAPIPRAYDVAEYGINAMEKGKSLAVHGFLNRFQVLLTRIFPRAWATHITARAMQK